MIRRDSEKRCPERGGSDLPPTMSTQPYLPREICDHIIDIFHDDPETLKRCCLVSKSWVPRTQKHLFSYVTFKSADYPKWRKTFPDPMNSPACYTQTLTVDGVLGCPEEMRQIESFSRIERLIVERPSQWAELPDGILYLSPFYKAAPSMKSLHVDSTVLPCSQVFNLVRSLPLLEDLTLITRGVDDGAGAKPSTPAPSPALTGNFELVASVGMEIILRILLGLQGGLRFRELRLSCCNVEDLTLVEELVLACSDTLESLDITCRIYRTSNPTSSLDRLVT